MSYRVSASQVDTFKTCKRKWAWRYIAGIKTPQHPSAALGSELHAIAEAYLKDGTYPDRLTLAGSLFIAGLPHLPPPKSGGVEGDFELELDGVTYVGQIDYRGYNVPGFAPDRRVIIDHKTSKSPKRYGLWTREQFLAHPQTVLYGTEDLLTNNAQDSQLRWLYYPTGSKSSRPEPSDMLLTRAELEDHFESAVHNSAKEIVRLKVLAPDPLTLDPTPSACEAYGGCAYRDRCNLSMEEKLRGTFEVARKKEEDVSVLNKLKSQTSNNGAGAPAEEKKEDRINAPEAQQEQKRVETTVAPSEEVKAKISAKTTKDALEVVAATFHPSRTTAVAKVLRAIADLLESP